jgi:hypothetical protein
MERCEDCAGFALIAWLVVVAGFYLRRNAFANACAAKRCHGYRHMICAIRVTTDNPGNRIVKTSQTMNDRGATSGISVDAGTSSCKGQKAVAKNAE